MPLTVVRAVAAIGGLLYGLMALCALMMFLSGWVNWTTPAPYLVGLGAYGGLALNIALAGRARILSKGVASAMTITSIALSSLVVGLVVYVSTG